MQSELWSCVCRGQQLQEKEWGGQHSLAGSKASVVLCVCGVSKYKKKSGGGPALPGLAGRHAPRKFPPADTLTAAPLTRSILSFIIFTECKKH